MCREGHALFRRWSDVRASRVCPKVIHTWGQGPIRRDEKARRLTLNVPVSPYGEDVVVAFSYCGLWT